MNANQMSACCCCCSAESFAFEDDSASSGQLASQKDTIGTPGALVRLQEIQYGIEKGALNE